MALLLLMGRLAVATLDVCLAPSLRTLTETGEEITDDPNWADAVQACASCDHVFRVSVGPGDICWGAVAIAEEVSVA